MLHDHALGNDLAYHSTRLATHKARLWLLQGNLEAAVNWAEDLTRRAPSEPGLYRLAEYVTLAEVRIAENKPIEAEQLLGWLLREAERTGRTGTAIKILALQSLAFQAQGSTSQALTTLERALSLAEPERYIRTFVDLGRPLADLLVRRTELRSSGRSAVEDVASLGYVRRLLAAFGSFAALPQSEYTLADPDRSIAESLSKRELQVLQMIAAGRSTPEIASEFVVAVSTVRTHVQSIYGKLEAHNRTQALARARELNLLP